jgi:hypothetical protein
VNGLGWLPVGRRGSQVRPRAELPEQGGPEFWDRFMDELREQHLGIPRKPGIPSVFAELQAAYEAAVEEADSTPPHLFRKSMF